MNWNAILPLNPVVSVEGDKVCVDKSTEQALQRMRVAGMAAGPVVMWAGLRYPGSWTMKAVIMGLGASCTAYHYVQYKSVKEVMNK